MATRKAKNTKSEIDLLKPVNVSQIKIDDKDCFGNMWDPQDKDCSICADAEVCGIIYQEHHIKPKTEKFEKQETPLDLMNFNKVEWEKIIKLVKRYEGEGSPLLFDELVDIVCDYASTKDRVTAEIYITKILPEHNLVEKNGAIQISN